MPRGKKFTAEQIIGKLRESEVELAWGKTVPDGVWKLGVTEQTHHCWKRECGGLRTDRAKRLKDLENENARLKRLLAREVFDTLLEATVLGERWRKVYNTVRPHSSLGYRPPAPVIETGSSHGGRSASAASVFGRP
jgi:putative transposase